MKIAGLKLLVLPLLLLIVSAGAEAAQKQGVVPKDESLRKGETRATLDPGQFKDARVKEAYRVAKEIPWVLDSIYCFCMCKESPTFRHKSLLSCYVDNHAAV
ncbi:MAG: hypothetical protein HZB62_04995 [Nitrospirae bacterium]|nr:hypothetical protein [Nitrospirota bacterium]